MAAGTARGVAAVCSPVDLAAGGRAIGAVSTGLFHARMFLDTMKLLGAGKCTAPGSLF